MPRSEGPYKITENVNDIAYKLDLGGSSAITATFNVGDLAPYIADAELHNLKANSSEEGEDDLEVDDDSFNYMLLGFEGELRLDLNSIQAQNGNWITGSVLGLCMVIMQTD